MELDHFDWSFLGTVLVGFKFPVVVINESFKNHCALREAKLPLFKVLNCLLNFLRIVHCIFGLRCPALLFQVGIFRESLIRALKGNLKNLRCMAQLLEEIQWQFLHYIFEEDQNVVDLAGCELNDKPLKSRVALCIHKQVDLSLQPLSILYGQVDQTRDGKHEACNSLRT